MPEWLKGTGLESDIVISSRIRIARNVEAMPFPHYLNREKARGIIENVSNSIKNSNCAFKDEFNLIMIEQISMIERLSYVEKHLISPALARNDISGAVLINDDGTISIMINEEDHIRIQCLQAGLQLDKCLELANKVDDLIEENIKFAFDDNLGYLTSCPTNVGTGIRASSMVHLPALSLTGHINGVLQVANKIGIAVRGIYGEGSQYLGSMYQISNQVTLGVSEQEIVENLHNVTLQIVQNERIARENLLKLKSIELEDKVFRSYGTLKSARLLTSNEAMQLISDIKLGVNLNLIDGVSIEKLNELILILQPGYLQKHFNMELSGIQRDIKRAELMRENIG